MFYLTFSLSKRYVYLALLAMNNDILSIFGEWLTVIMALVVEQITSFDNSNGTLNKTCLTKKVITKKE